jgi:hypothetical protein
MTPAGLETENDYAGEGQEQFNRPNDWKKWFTLSTTWQELQFNFISMNSRLQSVVYENEWEKWKECLHAGCVEKK